MSVSTDAILFYGYCWSEETDIFRGALGNGDDKIDWPETVLCRRGLVNPWEAAPADLNRYLPGEGYEQKEARVKAWCEAHRDDLDAWHEANRAVKAEFGVEVGRHCSGDWPMPYLTLLDPLARITARRGYPVPIDVTHSRPEILVPPPEWAEKLGRFLAEFGIQQPQPQPGWWLVSYWG